LKGYADSFSKNSPASTSIEIAEAGRFYFCKKIKK